ncbi:cyclic AMP-dependent transcription factor ATF-3-like isoform X2 [Acanthaster planci]|nr:cyclic AMP-dependent transcription factor ATF-3-like isoform X2 [Acanthaster planci]XP_022105127.1 cyclic AMP-dependent transcription factor ATF-3-like isoform X2 [Acanthaster planci]XP_022105135.1 cyclic AMP-dependent transcription factor ATF-3-like isoform X2 [Acanthaster planci]
MSSSASKLPTGSRRSLWRSVSNENQDVQGAAIVPRHLFGESSYDGDAKHLIDKGFPQRKAACLQPLQSNGNGAGQHGSLYRSISNDSEQSDADFDLLPLIKEELRNNIQKRRWQRGVLDLALEDYDKEKYQDDQLTPEEQAKREDRKNRNREAAARCRAKRRKHMEELEQSMVNLESRKNELIQQKEQLLREKRELEKMVDDHFRLCPCNNEMRGT